MAHVFWPARGDDFVPSSLRRIPFTDIAVDLDTSEHYIQGKVLIKYAVYRNTSRTFLKIVLTEGISNVNLSLFLINDICEKCQSINVGDTMTLTGFKVEMETNSVLQGYHDCVVIAMPSSPPTLTVWIQVQAPPEVRNLSDTDTLATVECLDGSERNSTTSKTRGSSKSRSTEQSSSHGRVRAAKSADKSPSSITLYASAQSTINTRAIEAQSSSNNDTSLPVKRSKSSAAASKSHLAEQSSSSDTTRAAKAADKSPLSCASYASAQSSISTRAIEAQSSSNNDSTSSPVKRGKPPTPYVYTAIKDVKAGTTVNLFGVIKFVRPASRGRGIDHNILLSIVDQSLTDPFERLKCMLFARDVRSLPDANVGDIIRFHRLKVTTYKDELQGQNGPGFAWMLFDHSADAVPVPRITSSTCFTFTDDDKCRVRDLIDWAGGDNSLLSQDVPASSTDSLITLSSVTVNGYFNLVCQVVAVCVLTEDKSMLLRVWDGTKITVPTYKQEMNAEPELLNRLVTDKKLARVAREYVVDLWVYDDHFSTAKLIKPGDFVSMTNVHAMIHKPTDAERVSLPPMTVELCIHGGGREKYSRGLTIVDDTVPAVQRLKLILSECIDDSDGGFDEERFENADADRLTSDMDHSTAGNEGPSSRPVIDVMDVQGVSSGCLKRSSRIKQPNAKRQKLDAGNSSSTAATGSSHPTDNDEAIVVSSSLTSDGDHSADSSSVENTEERCLLNTSTVVTSDHREIERTRLRDVLAHPPPYKFRVCANVIKYMPRAEHPLDIIQLFCPVCKFLSPVPSDVCSDDNVNLSTSLAAHLHHVDNGVSIYMCPHCSPSSRPSSRQSVVYLTYVYMLEFVLDDGSGWLSAGLWKEEAVKFFHGVESIELMRNRAKFNDVQRQLNRMCCQPSESTAGHQKMECCLMSYSTPCGKAYQIFDTELSLT